MHTFIALTLTLASLTAEAEVRQIPPSETDINIQQKRGPHLAYYDTQSPSNGLLLITIGGTQSKPSDLAMISERGAKAGYNVLSIDYPNEVISTVCRKSQLSDCSNRLRQEEVYGVPFKTDPDEVIDKKNAVDHRLRALLRTMNSGKDAARWAPYLKKNGEIDWSKIVVIGHSKGSGLAAYLAKEHKLHGAIMIAGPNDAHEQNGPAPWLRTRFETDKKDLLFFLHARDHFQFNSETQLKNVRAVIGATASTTDANTPQEGSQILMSNSHEGEPGYDSHMQIIKEEYRSQYDYLLKRAATVDSNSSKDAQTVKRQISN